MLEVVARELEPADHWPWRVTQLVGADRSRLVITLLHQAGDGASLLAVTKELGLLLMRPDEERPPAPPERGLDLLARGKGLADLFRLLPALTREAFQPLAVPFIARTAPPYRHPVAGAAPTFVVREVTAEVGPGSALRDLCRELGCTVNDALVAAVAVLIGQISERGRIGAFFTANLRRYLDDDRPRVANLSSFDLVILARHRVNSLAEAMLEVSRRIRRKKRRIPGLVLVLGSAVLGAPIPFGLARALGRLLSSGMRHLATRGVMVTNIGPMDHALAPFGERVTAASVIGPFLHGHQIPIITATSFRGRLSLAVNGFDDTPEERWQQIVSVLSRALTGLD
jgi:NRPS condensation-like uncharacterized protein